VPRFPRVFSLALLILILPSLTGCHSWHTMGQPVPEVIMAHPGVPLRVGLADGTLLEVDSARINSDSVVVWRPPRGSHEYIAADSVQGVQVRRPERIRTVTILGGLVLVGVAVAAMVSFACSDSCFPFCDLIGQ